MLPLADPRLRRDRDGQIAGLKSSSTTGDLKQKLQEAWFDGRKDYITNFDFAAIARYYGDKGDEYIQIGRSGLYAFSEQAAQNLGVPLFVNSGLEAYVRFRIKPHGATNGTHSFTVAIKIRGDLSAPPSLCLIQQILKRLRTFFLDFPSTLCYNKTN